MSLPARAIRKIMRETQLMKRSREARRMGLVRVPPNLFFFDDKMGPDSVVLDVGCGPEAELALYVAEKYGARAFAVDPTRKHRSALRALEERCGESFKHVDAAVTLEDGTLTFHESVKNRSGSLLSDHANVEQDEVISYDVEALTIDSLRKRAGADEVELLKLDLEGAEYDLLNGLNPDDLAPFRQILVEFHHHCVERFTTADTQRLVDRLSAGRKMFSLGAGDYLFYR